MYKCRARTYALENAKVLKTRLKRLEQRAKVSSIWNKTEILSDIKGLKARLALFDTLDDAEKPVNWVEERTRIERIGVDTQAVYRRILDNQQR
ncbi:MAG: hypothetical protein PHV99_02215 [Candidatus Pacebacteria bacterium]|nr:hypothetical protein [Candidatus Paceibacterota bacterium]